MQSNNSGEALRDKVLSWKSSTFVLYHYLTIMAINFPSKTAKKTSLLVDALRIMAWEEYKAVNKDELEGLEYGGYQVFAEEWKAEEIHKFTYLELVDFCKALDYTPIELLNYRSEYYAKKKGNSSKYATNGKSESKSEAYPDEQMAF